MALDERIRRIATPIGRPVLTAEGAALSEVATPPLPGYVRLKIVDGAPLRSIDLYTLREPYMLPDGYASGWEDLERPDNVAVSAWRGGAGLRQRLDVTLDVLADRRLDVDEEWHELQRLARPPRGKRPPILRCFGPVEHRDKRWVIAELAPDEETLQRLGDRIVRIDVGIVLKQWVPADLVDEETGATRRATRAPEFEIARQGDTLKTIAKRRLGSARKWTEIRDAPGNRGKLRDPNRKLKTGTQVWLP